MEQNLGKHSTVLKKHLLLVQLTTEQASVCKMQALKLNHLLFLLSLLLNFGFIALILQLVDFQVQMPVYESQVLETEPARG